MHRLPPRTGRLLKSLAFCLVLPILSAGTPPPDNAPRIAAAAPGGLFYDSEKPVFHFRIPSKTAYSVRDIYGTEKLTGTVEPGDNTLPPLPRGAYFLSLQGDPGDYSFSVLAPRPAAATGAAAVVAIDSGLDAASYRDPKESWKPGRDLMTAVCERIGLDATRGRSGWHEEKIGEYTFSPQIEAAKLARARGVDILGMTDMPAGEWTRTGCTWKSPMGQFQRKRNRGLPDDLRRTFTYFRDCAAAAGPALRYYEFLNEPDHDGYPPWEIAAQSKAAFLGFRRGNPALKVLSPSFCGTNTMFMKNYLHDTGGMYFDIFNCHIYYHLAALPQIFEIYRSALEQSGLGGRAVWITEFGSNAEDACRAGGYSPLRPNIHVPTREQELAVAEFVAKAFLRWIALGADKAFLFYLPPYSERGGLKEWGQLRFDRTARPSLTAMAVLVRQLAGARYLGTLKPAPGCTGLLFSAPGGGQVLAVWRPSEIDRVSKLTRYELTRGTPLTLRVRPGRYTACDMYGAETLFESRDGRITIPVGSMPVYLRGPGGFRAGNGPVRSPGTTVAAAPGDVDREIVMRLIMRDGLSIDSGRNFALMNATSAKLLLEVYNLGDSVRRGRISAGFDAGSVGGLPPGEIELAPMECREFPLTLELTARDRIRSGLEFSGEFNGRKLSPASASLILPVNAGALVARPPAAAGQASAWRPNCSGRMRISQDGDAVDFSADFTGTTDRWCYPEYLFRNGDTLAHAVGVSFETRLDEASKTSTGWRIYLVAGEEHETGTAQTVVFHVPSDTAWNRIDVFFRYDEEFLSRVRQMRIGFGSRTGNANFKIRNFKLLFRK